ncbi:uncharacterized protein LOC111613403 [Centruroides sculpturatus]|uniref:uncharacterized protein LOC111613403 n=1 Tax=Centruroides sculpturatus TaxID=218467 RepID=UPI000C6DFF61|nr:uncharacterized protein LOC111613403 [Centruroides sculpturatus]XP_023210519.1 uncharacterized protein LOC111613403 [Centruroides sculpturatus]
MYPSIKQNRILKTLKTYNCNQWIIDMTTLVLENNYFKNEGKFYRQNDGIPIGSVIGPVLADLSMTDIDKKVASITGIKNLQRYVDDCFIVYDSNIINTNQILALVNEIDPNIKFDLEPEINCQLPFLDILVTRLNNKTTFKKYKKPCTVDSIIHYTSEVPSYIKKNIFYMYIDKIVQRTTSETDRTEEIQDVIKTFLMNGYNKSTLNKWLNIKGTKKHKNNNTTQKYFKIPYEQNLFERIKSVSHNYGITLAPEKFPCLNYKINPHSTNNNTNIWDQKNIIYKLSCNCTNPKSYIGETGRNLKTRFKEHIAAIKYNNCNSAVAVHCNNEGCQILKESVKIVKKELHTQKRRWYEHLEILKNKDSVMNNNIGQKLHETWYPYLTKRNSEGGVNST